MGLETHLVSWSKGFSGLTSFPSLKIVENSVPIKKLVTSSMKLTKSFKHKAFPLRKCSIKVPLCTTCAFRNQLHNQWNLEECWEKNHVFFKKCQKVVVM